MKKRTLGVLMVAILIAAVIFYFIDTNTAEETTPETTIDTSMAPLALLKQATISVPDADTVVTLVDGEATFETVPGSAGSGSIALVENAFAQWGESGRSDLLTVLAVQSGGSGTFYYLVLFDVAGTTFTKKSEVFLGDRIAVTHVGIGELVHDTDAEYRVTVQTLVRADGEPSAATPTVQKTRTFYVADQHLEEITVGRDDS